MKKYNRICSLLFTAALTVTLMGCSSSTSEPISTSGAGESSGTSSSSGTGTSSGSGTEKSDGSGVENAEWEDMKKLEALDPADITEIGYFVLDEGGGFEGEVTDPGAIADIRQLLLNLKVGEVTDMMWTDVGGLIRVETKKETLIFSYDGFSVELSDGLSYELENTGRLERYLELLWQEEQEAKAGTGTSSGSGKDGLIPEDEFEGSYVFDVDENELVLMDGEETIVFPGGLTDGPYYMVEKIELNTTVSAYVEQELEEVISYYQNRLAAEPKIYNADPGGRELTGLEYKFSTVDGTGGLLHEAEYFEAAGAGSAWKWYALYEDGEEDVLTEMMHAIESFRLK